MIRFRCPAEDVRHQLLIGYCFRREDFPWVAVWEENRAISAVPWQHRTEARGLEFGTTPTPSTREDASSPRNRDRAATDNTSPARDAKAVPPNLRWIVAFPALESAGYPAPPACSRTCFANPLRVHTSAAYPSSFGFDVFSLNFRVGARLVPGSPGSQQCNQKSREAIGGRRILSGSSAARKLFPCSHQPGVFNYWRTIVSKPRGPQ